VHNARRMEPSRPEDVKAQARRMARAISLLALLALSRGDCRSGMVESVAAAEARARADAALTLDAAASPLDGGARPDATILFPAAAAAINSCPTGGLAGHVEIASAYWAASQSYGEHLGELSGALNAGHVSPESLTTIGASGPAVIVDVLWYLFDAAGHLAPNLVANLDRLQLLLAGHESRVRAFYVFDEPYLDAHRTPRAVLEQGIAALKARFPGVPAYITFGHHCFDPAVTDAACSLLSPAQRGLPANLDWASFDWYSDGSCGATPAQQFACHVEAGLVRLKALSPTVKILLTGEACDLYVGEPGIIEAAHRAFGLSLREPRVIGVDSFLWTSVAGQFHGLRDLPAARATVRALGREVLAACGSAPDSRIPVFAWSLTSVPDFDFRPWYWKGWEGSGYTPLGAAFALAAAGTPGTSTLYSCTLSRPAGVVDHGYLTTSPRCDGAKTIGAPVPIGAIFTAQAPGTVPLHRAHYQNPPWDAWYSTSATLPAGYLADFDIGFVYPASDL
jgi:hypothetical protein